MVLYHPDMNYANFYVPDPGIRFFVRQSGFSKSTYLESTCYGGFLEAKILPDKISPGTGFALNQSFSDIFLNLSLMFIQNDQKQRFFISRIFPGCQNPDFGCTVRFFNKYIFALYMVWRVSGCKNFPVQTSSRIRFSPGIRIFCQISGFLNFSSIFFFLFGLLWSSIACSGLLV